VSDEERDIRVGRRIVELARGCDLDQVAVADNSDAVGDRQCLLLVVGHEESRDAGGALDAEDFVAQLEAEAGIERRQGLVEQQAARLEDQGPRQRHALLLPARERRRRELGPVAHADPLERTKRLLSSLLAADAAYLQRISDVLPRQHVREQRV
jgi:hypothetical protein